jgi:hypothetical protein
MAAIVISKPTGALALVLLAGCSTQWAKPGASEQDFKSARYACDRDNAAAGAGGTGLFGVMMIRRSRRDAAEMRDECMEAAGWRKY